VTLLFTKVSILLLFLSILTYEWIKWATRTVLVLVIGSSIFIVGTTFTACIPLPAYWDRSIKATYCHPVSFYWISTALLIGSDFLIYLLPRKRLSLSQRDA
jgi:O-antigen ligase